MISLRQIQLLFLLLLFSLPCVSQPENYAESEVKTISVTKYGKTVIFNMVHVEAGMFKMGGTKSADEKPIHNVRISKSFYIGQTEVTQELWMLVMEKNPSHFKGPVNPVEKISWDDCKVFIERLNILTGLKFRLPTEAEWEYAARGGNKSRNFTYSGSNKIKDVCWYSANSGWTTRHVATKAPNELGIYDMSGNVWEWCEDVYDKHYYRNGALSDPKGPESGSFRVFRGGSFLNLSADNRVSYRYYESPSFKGLNLGLRLAM